MMLLVLSKHVEDLCDEKGSVVGDLHAVASRVLSFFGPHKTKQSRVIIWWTAKDKQNC
jgi:hypothetical protein